MASEESPEKRSKPASPGSEAKTNKGEAGGDDRDEVNSSSTAGMVATPADVFIVSDPDGCEKLKKMVNTDDKDAKKEKSKTPMVVVLARSDKNEQQSSAKKEKWKTPMDSRLLMALRNGDDVELEELLTGTEPGDAASQAAPAPDSVPRLDFDRPGAAHVSIQVEEQGNEGRGRTGEQIETAASVPEERPVVTQVNEGGGLNLDGVTFGSEGDSALHVLAASGDIDNYLYCAQMIYFRANRPRMAAENEKGDTPVHCAARAGNRKMVARLIEMAHARENNKVDLLRKPNNMGETALHCAIRNRDTQLIQTLLGEDPELGRFPEGDNVTSPLYLAISSELCLHCVRQLFGVRGRMLSTSGPHGQNVLHIAVWRDVLHGKALQLVFKLCPTLKKHTEQGDKDGNTPLHFAASMDMWKKSFTEALFLDVVGQHMVYPFWFLRRMPKDGPTMELIQATQPPGSSLFKPDNEGSYPIHVAAASGRSKAAIVMLESFPTCATLRDGRGRTFLHVAVDKNNWVIAGYTSRYPKFEQVLNMQDNNGNTALHLAIQSGNEWTFRYLFQNRRVRLDLPNEDGLTAIMLAWRKIPARGRFYHMLNPRRMIYRALSIARAAGVFCRMDQVEEKYISNSEIDEDRLSDNITKASQVMGVLAGLVTSVTFAAAFKLPGGYRSGDADDHGNSETPWLAGTYAFDAFIISIALAFMCSLLATIGLLYSGFDSIDYTVRKVYFTRSYRLLQSSARSLAVAFGLGIYLVMAPVAHKIATAVCIIIFGGLVFQNFEIRQSIVLANTIRIRCGLRAALSFTIQRHWEPLLPLTLVVMVEKFWCLVIIFVLPAPWIYWIFLIILLVMVAYW